MSIIDDYFKYTIQYSEKYGDKCVVLMQVGSFYEIYEYDPELDINDDKIYPHKIGHATDLSSILNMTLTRKNKNKPHCLNNPFMIGFPIISYDNHRIIILEHNYTIVKIDQQGSGSNIVRSVSEVLSAGTEIDNIGTLPLTNNIVSIYIECQKVFPKLHQYIIICGLSSIDVSCGKSHVNEVYSKDNDHYYAISEVYRYIICNSPREILIHINKVPENLKDEYIKYISDNLQLHKYCNVIIKFNSINKDFFNISYQQTFLNKIFPTIHEQLSQQNGNVKISYNNIIEHLDLESFKYGTISYLILLQYCYDHNELIIKSINVPETSWTDGDNHLILMHNAICQLNIIPTPKTSVSKNSTIDSLYSVVNFTSTSMGKRYLRNMLLNPITNVQKLNQYYQWTEMIDTMIIDNNPMLDMIEQYIKHIPDLERYHRKLFLGTIKPIELCTLFRGYSNIIQLLRIIISTKNNIRGILPNKKYVKEFGECCELINTNIIMDKLEKCKVIDRNIEFDESFFVEGYHSDVDDLSNQLFDDENKLTGICDHLNSFLSSSRGKLIEINLKKGKKTKLSEEEDEQSVPIGTLITTNHKASVIKKSPINVSICGQLEFKSLKQNTLITSDIIRKYFEDYNSSKYQLQECLKQKYIQLINQLNEYTFYSPIVLFIGLLDFIKSNVKLSKKYKYFKPCIDNTTDQSFVKITDMRHPIIERLINSEYITNNINLGYGGQYGLIVFSQNGCGKSSLMKSVALNLILAQAGLYTPCKMVYHPYNRIITRLSGYDDIFTGDSSFAIEIKELRTILKNSDNHSLVIIDELCRGTESDSGTSLTIATIEELISRDTSFILSTHLHNIVSTKYISSIDSSKLGIYHLSTHYDSVNQVLVYDRLLKEGSGSSVYGLEVARYLDLDPTFIDKANTIRKDLFSSNLIIPTKKSRYNCNIYMDCCQLCGKKNELHTHHIRPQSEASSDNFIDHFHKNSAFNLMVLCRECHQKIHSLSQKLVTQETPNHKIVSVHSDEK